MSDQFVGEIRIFGGRFTPLSWLSCNGGLHPIAEYEALFTLIGTTYGGDGQSTFAVPDLRGRVPVGMGTFQGTTSMLGEQGGVETVTLTKDQLAAHNHAFMSTPDTGTAASPNGAVPASLPVQATQYAYGLDAPYRAVESHTIELVGGGQLHTNIQPYMALNFIIAYHGVFPPPGEAGDLAKEATE